MTRLTSSAERLSRTRRLAKSGAAKAIRVSSDLSLRDIARDVGVSPSTILRWETGQRAPSGAAGKRYGELINSLSRGL